MVVVTILLREHSFFSRLFIFFRISFVVTAQEQTVEVGRSRWENVFVFSYN